MRFFKNALKHMKQSNLLYFFLLLVFSSVFCSCSKSSNEEEVIPSVYVYGIIRLDYYPDLNAIGNALYFNEIETSTGYLGHGFIVVRTSQTKFAVFDASCTHDRDAEEHIEINGTFAECPICESKFNIFTGWPFNGSAANNKLEEYKSYYSSNSNTLKVYN